MTRYQGLPPVDQVVGFNTAGNGSISPNPVQNQFQYFTDSQGNPISAVNAGDATANFGNFGGNPLNYGQTMAYTGPSGPTDSPTMAAPLPAIEEAVASADPIGKFTQMDAYDILGKISRENHAGGVNMGNLDALKVSDFLKMEADGSYSPSSSLYNNFANIGQLDTEGNEITKDRVMQQFLAQTIDESV